MYRRKGRRRSRTPIIWLGSSCGGAAAKGVATERKALEVLTNCGFPSQTRPSKCYGAPGSKAIWGM